LVCTMYRWIISSILRFLFFTVPEVALPTVFVVWTHDENGVVITIVVIMT